LMRCQELADVILCERGLGRVCHRHARLDRRHAGRMGRRGNNGRGWCVVQGSMVWCRYRLMHGTWGRRDC
jgi:hypothetical protein